MMEERSNGMSHTYHRGEHGVIYDDIGLHRVCSNSGCISLHLYVKARM